LRSRASPRLARPLVAVIACPPSKSPAPRPPPCNTETQSPPRPWAKNQLNENAHADPEKKNRPPPPPDSQKKPGQRPPPWPLRPLLPRREQSLLERTARPSDGPRKTLFFSAPLPPNNSPDRAFRHPSEVEAPNSAPASYENGPRPPRKPSESHQSRPAHPSPTLSPKREPKRLKPGFPPARRAPRPELARLSFFVYGKTPLPLIAQGLFHSAFPNRPGYPMARAPLCCKNE